MKRLLGIVLLAGLLACSSANDIVFGPEPLKQIAEQGDKFRTIPEEDRMLLVRYVTAMSIGSALGGDVKPITGRTVGEVLGDARAWNEKMKVAKAEQERREAEAEALRAKVAAERKAIAEKIAGMVTIAVTDKVVLPKNYDVGRYNELLMIKYALENKSDKTIRQIKGEVVFEDPTGDEVGSLNVDFNEPIAPGKTLKTDTGMGWRTNRFSMGDIERIAARDFSTMKASFRARSIAFEGGEVLKAPE